MIKTTEGPYYYQLTEAQHRAVVLNAGLARAIFRNDPSFSASGGSWRWQSYQHVSTGVDIKVDSLEGRVHYFKYGYVTISGLPSVTIPLDIFSDETIALTHWKLKPPVDAQPQPQQGRLL